MVYSLSNKCASFFVNGQFQHRLNLSSKTWSRFLGHNDIRIMLMSVTRTAAYVRNAQ